MLPIFLGLQVQQFRKVEVQLELLLENFAKNSHLLIIGVNQST
jgi:hypothetical protein